MKIINDIKGVAIDSNINDYADYLTDVTEKTIAYSDYITHMSLCAKDFIIKCHSRALSDTLKSNSHESLEAYAEMMNDFINIQEILAEKLDKLINNLDDKGFNEFREAYDEVIGLKSYKREAKINQITDVNEHSR